MITTSFKCPLLLFNHFNRIRLIYPGPDFLHSCFSTSLRSFNYANLTSDNRCYRLFSSKVSHKHDLDKVDRLDSYISSIPPQKLENFHMFSWKEAIKRSSLSLGYRSYVYSEMMTFTFEEATFLEEQYIKLIEKKAETFLRTLKPNTVYKGIFISINEELGVLSSVEGSFFFSTNTRPVYIAMKLRQAVRAYAARYAAQNPEY